MDGPGGVGDNAGAYDSIGADEPETPQDRVRDDIPSVAQHFDILSEAHRHRIELDAPHQGGLELLGRVIPAVIVIVDPRDGQGRRVGEASGVEHDEPTFAYDTERKR